MPPLTRTPLQLHIANWKNCTRCHLCHDRQNVVLYRGKIPCDLLFIGEAPGDSEDTFALPFYGPAGYLLNDILKAALPDNARYAIGNLIGCIPYEQVGDTRKITKPPYESVLECRPRVEEFITLAKPKALIAVGDEARDYLTPGYKYSIAVPKSVYRAEITHPSAILRAKEAQKGLAIQRCVIVIRNTYAKVMSGST